MTLTAVVAVAAATLAACGSDTSSAPRSASSSKSTMSAAEAYSAVKSSIELSLKAKTFRVVANGTDDGKPLVFDLHYGSNGVDGSVQEQGTTFTIKTVGNALYFKAPRAFWREQGGSQGQAIVDMYGGKWVKSTTTSGLGKSFSEFADGDKFLQEFLGGTSKSDLAGAKLIGTSTVGGTATKTFSDGSNEGSVDIAASGAPYLLRIISKPSAEDEDSGTVTLSSWNQPYVVQAPKSSVPLPS